MCGCQPTRTKQASASATMYWRRCHGYWLSWRFQCLCSYAWR